MAHDSREPVLLGGGALHEVDLAPVNPQAMTRLAQIEPQIEERKLECAIVAMRTTRDRRVAARILLEQLTDAAAMLPQRGIQPDDVFAVHPQATTSIAPVNVELITPL